MSKKAFWTILSIIAFIGTMYWWLKDWFLVIMVFGSITLHELGHIVMFLLYGIRTNLYFVPFLGAATVPQDIERVNNLSFRRFATMALSGPFINVILMSLGLIAWLITSNRYALSFTSLNASLTAFNLLPFGIFDGGKVIPAIFS
jgi:Zn-dependent protease